MNTIDKINYYLAKQKKTGADLCEFLGVSSGVYSQWNTGRTKPRKNKLPAIAEYLGVTIENLLPDEPQRNIKSETVSNGDGQDKLTQNLIQKIINASFDEKKIIDEYIDFIKKKRT